MLTSNIKYKPGNPKQDAILQIVNRCIEGERRSEKALFDHIRNIIYSMCLKVAATPQDAEDLFQEITITVFKNLMFYKGNSDFKSWVRRIAVFRCENYTKYPVINLTAITKDVINSSGTEAIDPLSKLFENDIINIYCSKLSKGYKTVFKLRYSGFSHYEIAQQLGISESTSRSQLTRAAETLRALIQNNKGTKKQDPTTPVVTKNGKIINMDLSYSWLSPEALRKREYQKKYKDLVKTRRIESAKSIKVNM